VDLLSFLIADVALPLLFRWWWGDGPRRPD
jgi:hypothetical protein